jgi:hypothetical protein
MPCPFEGNKKPAGLKAERVEVGRLSYARVSRSQPRQDNNRRR